jgi:hypothetical protein
MREFDRIHERAIRLFVKKDKKWSEWTGVALGNSGDQMAEKNATDNAGRCP